MTQKSLVIVGNGMATGRLLDELGKRDLSRFDITVIGDEPQGSYNRIMLSPVLAGELQREAIVTKPCEWFAQQGIRFLAGCRVTSIDRGDRVVHTQCGQQVAYDELVLATGSSPARIPAKNQKLAHVYSFRTLADVAAIADSAKLAATAGSRARAVVVGGGLLGLEAAYGLALNGLKVTLIHRSGWLLNRQLDEPAAKLLETVMAAKGIDFELNCEVDSFVGERDLQAVRLNDGRTIEAQVAVIATGIRPNAELGTSCGLSGHRGIEVDALMRTSDDSISALGECVEFEGGTFGLVEPIWAHCRVLAARLCGEAVAGFTNEAVATKLKVSGVQLFSAGDFLTTPAHRELLYQDYDRGVYRKILLKDNRIVGVVLFGDTRDGQEYFAMMQNRTDVADLVPVLLLGKAFFPSDSAAEDCAA